MISHPMKKSRKGRSDGERRILAKDGQQ